MTAPAKVAAQKMTAAQVLARLQRHYLKPGELMPGGVLLPEVTLGRAGGKRCDAIFIGFTTTKGRYLIGHEIKVARSDWLHELEDADKADPWASQCHQWWVVAPNDRIVRREELPPGWGLMTCDGPSKTRLRQVAPAALDLTRTPSWEACLSIISRQDTLRGQAIGAARIDAQEEARAVIDRRVADGLDMAVARKLGYAPDVEALRARLALYEDTLGVKLAADDRTWRLRDGEITAADMAAIGQLLAGRHSIREAFEDLAGRYAGFGLENLAEKVAAARAALDALRAGGAQELADTPPES